MQPLQIEPVAPFQLPDLPFRIAVVGAGGNGSHVIAGLARLCYHLRETSGRRVEVRIIDGDLFEPKNVGRQLCQPGDVGKNKAEVLAARANKQYGLAFEAIPEMLDDQLLRGVIGNDEQSSGRRTHNTIVVGCVDNAATRQLLHRWLPGGGSWYSENWGWLDLGNHEYTGQVLFGTSAAPESMRGCMALDGLCTKLPSPGLVMPELITIPKLKTRRGRPRTVDCAADALANLQAFNINAVLAAIAVEYLTQLVTTLSLTRFQTIVDLKAFSARSEPITLSSVARASGLSADELRGREKPAQPAAPAQPKPAKQRRKSRKESASVRAAS